MRAIAATYPGTVDVLTEVDLPEPEVGDSQLLVRVDAVGVCGHDVLARSGAFPHVTFPLVPGHELSGLVVATGGSSSEFAVGQRVVSIQNQPCGSCADCVAGFDNRCQTGRGILGHSCQGATAELVIVEQRAAVRLPDRIGTAEGAVLACAVGTAVHALRRARMLPGESVLVTGAGGGVGIHALQLIKHLGGRAIAWARNGHADDVRDELRRNGADAILAGDLDPQRVCELTDGRGVDVVLEIVGSASFDRSLRCLRPGGRLTLVGNTEAAPIVLWAGRAILREAQITASLGCTRAELAEVVDLVDAGIVTPRISKRFGFDEVGHAHTAVEMGGNLGRIVVELNTGCNSDRASRN